MKYMEIYSSKRVQTKQSSYGNSFKASTLRARELCVMSTLDSLESSLKPNIFRVCELWWYKHPGPSGKFTQANQRQSGARIVNQLLVISLLESSPRANPISREVKPHTFQLSFRLLLKGAESSVAMFENFDEELHYWSFSRSGSWFVKKNANDDEDFSSYLCKIHPYDV
jgi:hypothetical protein